MSIILRVDDFPGTKPEEFWKHNLKNFEKFDAVFERHDFDYVLGVIPKHTTKEHVEFLAKNPRITVALHGINHDERWQNEFKSYQTEDDVHHSLVSAVNVLKECNGDGKIDTYIPPHNVFDPKTCNALKRSGFKHILCGPGSDLTSMEYGRSIGLNVNYSPFPGWYGRSDEMMVHRAIDVIRESVQSGMHEKCIALHWTWEWNIGLDSLDFFLEQIASSVKRASEYSS